MSKDSGYQRKRLSQQLVRLMDKDQKIFYLANNKPLSQIFKAQVVIVLQIAAFKCLV
jgi:hypothetical protein